jgi:hypothetical protein
VEELPAVDDRVAGTPVLMQVGTRFSQKRSTIHRGFRAGC